MTANAGAALLQHYVDNSRDLPWRARPDCGVAPDPYRVWLSEIMLQQTTVATVVPRFARFVERWPTVAALAAADDADVLSEWAGLGYYARARNLLACAREVVRMGGFPRTPAELSALPGIGSYTAAAIAAIAFNAPVIGVDTNVRRVVSRLYALERPTDAEIAAHALAMAPADRAGDFTQALMDLGAAICRPQAPRCNCCPMRDGCAGFANGNPGTYPASKPRPARPRRFGVAWWTERDGHVWLVRRPPRGLLGGMAALPGGEWVEEASPRDALPLATVRHVFTHFELQLAVEARTDSVGDGWWHPLAELDRAGLPTLYRRAADAARATSHALTD